MKYPLFLMLFISSLCNGKEKPIVIDICSYNNARWYQKNLDSVFFQKYSNYRVIYTDDCSSDGTADLVEEYITLNGKQDRIKLIRNSQRARQLSNHYRVIHQCDDDEIIIHLDGDDWLAHELVLEKINRAYQDPNIWMTYGSNIWWPRCKVDLPFEIPQEVVTNNSYRSQPEMKGASHLRTFYAWLAKQIKLKDLICPEEPFKGKFFPAAADWALLFPLFEMAGGKYKCFNRVLYIYNFDNPLNIARNDKSFQMICKNTLRKQRKYIPVDARPSVSSKRSHVIHADIPHIVVSQAFQSRVVKGKRINKIKNSSQSLYIVPAKKSSMDESGSISPSIEILSANWLTELNSLLALQEYTVITFGNPVISDANLNRLIPLLEQASAFGCYIGLHEDIKNAETIEWLERNVYFFKYKNFEENPHRSSHTVLVRSRDVQRVLAKLPRHASAKDFYKAWCKVVDDDAIALFIK